MTRELQSLTFPIGNENIKYTLPPNYIKFYSTKDITPDNKHFVYLQFPTGTGYIRLNCNKTGLDCTLSYTENKITILSSNGKLGGL